MLQFVLLGKNVSFCVALDRYVAAINHIYLAVSAPPPPLPNLYLNFVKVGKGKGKIETKLMCSFVFLGR